MKLLNKEEDSILDKRISIELTVRELMLLTTALNVSKYSDVCNALSEDYSYCEDNIETASRVDEELANCQEILNYFGIKR